MKIYGLFNPRAGVGKTTLAFNLGWLFAEAGFRVLIADLDPRGDLTKLARAGGLGAPTILDAVAPVPTHRITERLHLLSVDVVLATTDVLFAQGGSPQPSTSSIRDLLLGTAGDLDAGLVLCDLGSSPGAFTRAATWAADGLIVPLPSKEALEGPRQLQEVSESLRAWRSSSERSDAFELLGYVLTSSSHRPPPPLEGYRLLGVTRAYPSLYSMARMLRKPVFSLSPSDGALGSLQYAVIDALTEYEDVATHIANAGDLFDDMGLHTLVAEAIAEDRTEGNLEFELPFSAYVDCLTISRIDDARFSNGHIRVRGSGVLEVERVINDGDDVEPDELSFFFDLELGQDRSLAHLRELRIHSPDSSTAG